jgi:hypothetical protein
MSPVADWPSTWLSYSGYDGVITTREEFDQAPAPVRTALEQFVEAGGCLTVLGNSKLSPAWTERRVKHGSVIIDHPGFGTCFSVAETDPEKWGKNVWEHLAGTWLCCVSVWKSDIPESEANRQLKVGGGTTVSPGTLFGIMVLFCVVIGPVNLTILARKKRRIWMLWTVPVISLVTCGLVFGYMIVAEGWGGRRITQGITFLDETHHRATTIGWTAFYSPLPRSSGLHFSADTELTPASTVEMEGYGRAGNAHSLDWSTDQHLTSGWLTPRVPTHYRLRKSETRRERVNIHRQEGKLTLVNGLGAPINEIWYADTDGKVYAAGPVPAGGQAELKDTGRKAAADRDCMVQLYRANWLGPLTPTAEGTERYLLPRHYVATLGGSPFIEEGLPDAKVTPCQSLIYGISRGEGDAD